MRTEQTHRQVKGSTPLLPPAPKICTLVHGGRPYPGLPGLLNENSVFVMISRPINHRNLGQGSKLSLLQLLVLILSHGPPGRDGTRASGGPNRQANPNLCHISRLKRTIMCLLLLQSEPLFVHLEITNLFQNILILCKDRLHRASCVLCCLSKSIERHNG